MLSAGRKTCRYPEGGMTSVGQGFRTGVVWGNGCPSEETKTPEPELKRGHPLLNILGCGRHYTLITTEVPVDY